MKILIIGNGGTGKSTLAKKLGDALSIAVVHLDLLMWDKDWNRMTEKEFSKQVDQLVKNKHWIIEGWGYHSSLCKRVEMADVIIYLKFPLTFCLKSVLERNKEYNFKPNPFDPFDGDRLENHELYEEAVRKMHEVYEPELRKWLHQWEFSLKKIYTFTSRKELNSNYTKVLEALSY